MKTFSVAVAVAVALMCICIQQSSATFAEIRELQELQEAVSNDSPAAEHQEISADSWVMPYHRQKRGIKCRFCCGCCNAGVCGLCCRF
ncbi:hepcidin-like [Maylandia zebra]|uniref:Hepcidin-like n=2 Tax=Haplochromini TaxID=319058 RepID=A0A3P9CBF6_9CICH|nr:hepcidin-like [Maylandia zebra]XP_026032766.1 hepcidin-like [Astatotilapia calliptera]